MKKIFKLCFILLLIGCSSKLSDNYDKDMLLNKAKKEVELINKRNYEDVAQSFRIDLQSDELAASISTLDSYLEKLGAFKECPEYDIAPLKQDGYEYATIALKCKYENGNALFTITYDEDYELVGLFMK